MKSGSQHERNDGWKNPDKMARIEPPPLAEFATSLSAPKPKEVRIAKALCAPQPFSNAPAADIDGTQGRRPPTKRVPRTIIVPNNSSKNRRKSRKRSKQKSSRRIHGNGKLSSSSRSSSASRANQRKKNTTEPENDIGARPLESNTKRSTALFPSIVEETAKAPCASVAVAGSASTVKTVLTSFDHSVLSSKASPQYTSNTSQSSHRASVVRRKPYPRKLKQRSKASISSFTGDVLSTSHDSRDLNCEVSVVESVREARLEAEFDDRIKSEIVETVPEVHPFIQSDMEEPQTTNTQSLTHSQGISKNKDMNYESGSHLETQGKDTQEAGTPKTPLSRFKGALHATRIVFKKILCYNTK